MDNKKLGKILIRHYKKELKAFFSPACCFDEEKRRKHELKIYEIQKGENIIECECGKKYKINVNGELDDFKNIERELIES